MAFFVRSITGAPLTFAREQQQFVRSIPTGIYTGMQVHHGTAATYRVSLFAGVYAINGIVIFDDADQTDIFDLGAPGADEHHLVYVTYDPDTDTEPTYSIKEGTFAAPATLTPTEAANGFVIADIWLPSTAADITDAVIVNRDTVELTQSLVEFLGIQKTLGFKRTQVAVSGTQYTLHWDNMRLLAFSAKKAVDETPVQFPFVTHTLNTATTSTVYGGGGDDFEITYDIAGTPNDDYIFFYVVDPNDFDQSSTLTVRAIGHSETDTAAGLTELGQLLGNDDGSFTNQDTYPYRPDLKNTTILAVVDVTNGWVHYANGVAMPVDEEFADGSYLHYAQTLSSTIYGTGPVSNVSGDIDVDAVFDNMAILHAATLDDVYDGFETGSANGAGRAATIDAGAIDLSNVVDITPAAASGDQFNAALRIGLDTTATGDADEEERAIDIYSEEQESKRVGLSMRRPLYWPSGAAMLENINVTLTDVGNQVQVADDTGTPNLPTVTQYRSIHGFNDVHGQRRLVTFPSFVGGDAQYKVYYLRYDISGDYFYLETVDGVTDIDLTYNSDFNFAGVINTTMTVWEDYVQLGETSIVQDMEIQGTLTNAGGDTFENKQMFSGYDSIQDFVEDAALWWDPDLIVGRSGPSPRIKAAHINVPWMFRGQAWPLSGETRVGSGTPHDASDFPVLTDSRYVYLIEDFTLTNVPIKIFNAKDMSLVKTITTTDAADDTKNVTIAANGERLAIGYIRNLSGTPRIEVWDIEDNVEVWGITQPGSVGPGADPRRMLFVGNRLNVAWSGNTTDQVWTEFVASDGTLSTDSTAGNLNFTAKAQDAVDMAMWGSKLVILTKDATPDGYLTALYSTAVSGDRLAIDATNLDTATGGSGDPKAVSVNDDFLAVTMENTSGGLNTWIFELRVDAYGGSVLAEYKEFVHTSSVATSGPYQCQLIDNDHIIIQWYRNDSTTSSLEMWNLNSTGIGPVVKFYENNAGQVTGFDTDLQDVFYAAAGFVFVKSLGRRPGLWVRTENSRFTSFIQSYCRWLAMPAGNW